MNPNHAAMKYTVRLYKWSEYEWRDKDTGLMKYKKEKDYYDSIVVMSESEAVRVGELKTKGCDDLFWEVEESKL